MSAITAPNAPIAGEVLAPCSFAGQWSLGFSAGEDVELRSWMNSGYWVIFPQPDGTAIIKSRPSQDTSGGSDKFATIDAETATALLSLFGPWRGTWEAG